MMDRSVVLYVIFIDLIRHETISKLFAGRRVYERIDWIMDIETH